MDGGSLTGVGGGGGGLSTTGSVVYGLVGNGRVNDTFAFIFVLGGN